MSRAQIGPVRIAAALVLAETLLLAAVVGRLRTRLGRPPRFRLLPAAQSRRRFHSLPGWARGGGARRLPGRGRGDRRCAGHQRGRGLRARLARPAGTRFEYTLERNGERSIEGFESRAFTWTDAAFTFGVYLRRDRVRHHRRLGVGPQPAADEHVGAPRPLSALSTYLLTAIDLYGPHRFFALHALARSLRAGALLHLALVFPYGRTSPSAAAPRELPSCDGPRPRVQERLDFPALYPGIHSVASAGIVGAGIVLLAGILWSYLRSPSELVRHQVSGRRRWVVSAHSPCRRRSFSVSVLEGGRVPVNIAAFPPFSSRSRSPSPSRSATSSRSTRSSSAAFYYAILSGLVTATYLALAALATHVLQLSRVGQSTTFSLVFTLAMLLLLPGVREPRPARRRPHLRSAQLRRPGGAGHCQRRARCDAQPGGDPAPHGQLSGARPRLGRVAVFLQRGVGLRGGGGGAPGGSRGPLGGRRQPLIRLIAALPPPLVRDAIGGPRRPTGTSGSPTRRARRPS